MRIPKEYNESPTAKVFPFTNSFVPDEKRCLCGVPIW